MNTQAQQPETQIVEYSFVAAALSELRSRYKQATYAVATKEGMKEAKEARAELRGYRTKLEAKRKEIKAPALARCNLIDSEANRITEELVALEKPIAEQIKAEEERKEREENERKARLETALQQIVGIPSTMAGESSATIHVQIEELNKITIDESWQEFQEAARLAKQSALTRLHEMFRQVAAQEEEKSKLAKEREELERLRKAEEERQRAAEEARRKELEEQAARNRAAEEEIRKRREALEREEAEARARREQEETAARAAREKEEAERRAKEEAERKAREEAEAKRREEERLSNEAMDARAMLRTFITKFGHRKEFAAVVNEINKVLQKKAA